MDLKIIVQSVEHKMGDIVVTLEGGKQEWRKMPVTDIKCSPVGLTGSVHIQLAALPDETDGIIDPFAFKFMSAARRGDLAIGQVHTLSLVEAIPPVPVETLPDEAEITPAP